MGSGVGGGVGVRAWVGFHAPLPALPWAAEGPAAGTSQVSDSRLHGQNRQTDVMHCGGSIFQN